MKNLKTGIEKQIVFLIVLIIGLTSVMLMTGCGENEQNATALKGLPVEEMPANSVGSEQPYPDVDVNIGNPDFDKSVFGRSVSNPEDSSAGASSGNVSQEPKRDLPDSYVTVRVGAKTDDIESDKLLVFVSGAKLIATDGSETYVDGNKVFDLDWLFDTKESQDLYTLSVEPGSFRSMDLELLNVRLFYGANGYDAVMNFDTISIPLSATLKSAVNYTLYIDFDGASSIVQIEYEDVFSPVADVIVLEQSGGKYITAGNRVMDGTVVYSSSIDYSAKIAGNESNEGEIMGDSEIITLPKFFNLNDVGVYSYVLKNDAGGILTESNIITEVIGTGINIGAKDAWLLKSNVTTGSAKSATEMLIFMNKTCHSSMSIIDTGETLITRDTGCPETGPFSAKAASDELVWTDTESVRVAAGEYETKRYDSQHETYWIAEEVPVPVKYMLRYNGAALTYELVSYI